MKCNKREKQFSWVCYLNETSSIITIISVQFNCRPFHGINACVHVCNIKLQNVSPHICAELWAPLMISTSCIVWHVFTTHPVSFKRLCLTAQLTLLLLLEKPARFLFISWRLNHFAKCYIPFCIQLRQFRLQQHEILMTGSSTHY